MDWYSFCYSKMFPREDVCLGCLGEEKLHPKRRRCPDCNAVMYRDEITSEKVCCGSEFMTCTLFAEENKINQTLGRILLLLKK